MIIYLFSESIFNLQVLPSNNDQPRLGETLQLICQSPSNNPYGNPVWLDSNQQTILPRVLGRCSLNGIVTCSVLPRKTI